MYSNKFSLCAEDDKAMLSVSVEYDNDDDEYEVKFEPGKITIEKDGLLVVLEVDEI